MKYIEQCLECFLHYTNIPDFCYQVWTVTLHLKKIPKMYVLFKKKIGKTK